MLAWATKTRSTPEPLLARQTFVNAHTGEVEFDYSMQQRAFSRYIMEVVDGTPTFRRFEGQPAIGDSEVDLNYDHLGAADAFFSTHYGLDSYDDEGSFVTSYIREPISSPMWDGTALRFPNGYGSCDGIVAHEYAHAVTENWAELSGIGDAGAINESIADVWAEFIDWGYDNVNDPPDSAADRWLIGEDLTGGAINNMADPPAFDMPSWVGSGLFDWGDDLQLRADTNRGVGDKLWYLLTDGTVNEPDGKFLLYEFAGLGEARVIQLLEYCQESLAPNADYQSLYETLDDAKTDVNLAFTEAEQEIIEQACAATGIVYDTDPGDMNKALGGVYVAKGSKWNSAQNKSVPYKVYIPMPSGGSGDNRYRTITRNGVSKDLSWSPDVIIFSHGAGMNRNIASGSSSSSVPGLVKYWAQQGYTVVCPTHVARTDDGWEWLRGLWPWDVAYCFAKDLIRARSSTEASQFYADRVKDLQFVRDNLDDILDSRVPGSYVEGQTRVAVAGHSLGANTTLIAAGIDYTVDDLEGPPYNLEREDDFAFVPAEAYLVLSGGSYDEGSDLTSWDPSDPYRNGRDLIQKPYMQMTGEDDVYSKPGALFVPLEQTTHVHDVVENMNGARPYPARSVIIAEGNHLTPVSRFHTILFTIDSWEFGFTWNNLVVPFLSLDGGLGDLWELAISGGIDDAIETAFSLVFEVDHGDPSREEEEAKLQTYQQYTLAFWDTYLSPEYDFVRGQQLPEVEWGSELLDLQADDHEGKPWVWNGDDGRGIPGYMLSEPTQVVEVRTPSMENLLHLRKDGEVHLLRGGLQTGAQISEDPSKSELIIKNSNGEILAAAEESYGLKLKGQVFEQQTGLEEGAGVEFLVKDNEGNVMVKIDANGNLHMRSDFYLPGRTAY